MTQEEILAYLAERFPAPIKNLSWHSDEGNHDGVATLDVSGLVKDHDVILVGFSAPKGLPDDDTKIHLGHSVRGANRVLERLIAEKGAPEPKATA